MFLTLKNVIFILHAINGLVVQYSKVKKFYYAYYFYNKIAIICQTSFAHLCDITLHFLSTYCKINSAFFTFVLVKNKFDVMLNSLVGCLLYLMGLR